MEEDKLMTEEERKASWDLLYDCIDYGGVDVKSVNMDQEKLIQLVHKLTNQLDQKDIILKEEYKGGFDLQEKYYNVLREYIKLKSELEGIDIEGFAKFVNYDYWYSEKRSIWCEDDQFKLIDDCKTYTFDELYELFKKTTTNK